MAAAVKVTRAIEARVLEQAVRAITGLRGKRHDANEQCVALMDVMDDSNGFDLVVSAYRASPELLAVLLRSPGLRHRISSVIRRIGDGLIVEVAEIGRTGGPEELLSKRELEVYELLCAGLSNREIAKCLFISEATVKVHAHHIFDKLGIRSRHALALDAARRRAGQATDAT